MTLKRIGFVSTMNGSAWGGSEELWSQTAKRLTADGVMVGANVLWWPQMSQHLSDLSIAGCAITTRHKPIPRRQDLWKRLLPHRVYQRLYPDKAFSWLDHFRPDIVIISQGAHLDEECLLWIQNCVARGIPCAPVAQCAYEFLWPDDERAELFVQYYEKAAACFFVSQRNLNLTRTQLVTPLLNARIIRNPFNVSYSVKVNWPETEPCWRLACVARLEPRAKGQDLLFQVLRQEKWRRRPLQVTLFGTGPNQHRLAALKEAYGLTNVTFGGFNSDVASIWATHHALVLPSRYEGLPLAVVEAMLCGRISIVTDVAGNAELIQDGEVGFVAAAPTVGLLDEAMERAWERRDDWRRMGQAAAVKVRRLVPPDPAAVFAEEIKALL